MLLTPPADKATIKTEIIPGLKPITPPDAGGDTAKGVTLPAKPTLQARAESPAPERRRPARRRPRRAKPKG